MFAKVKPGSELCNKTKALMNFAKRVYGSSVNHHAGYLQLNSASASLDLIVVYGNLMDWYWIIDRGFL